MREELVTVHFDGITHIDMTYGLAVQQMQKHIDKTDAEIARLNALLAEAREGLKAALTLDDLYTIENMGGPHESDQATADISGVVKVIRATLAKLGA